VGQRSALPMKQSDRKGLIEWVPFSAFYKAILGMSRDEYPNGIFSSRDEA